MSGPKLLLLVDLAGQQDGRTTHSIARTALLVARILCSINASCGSFDWGYKLIHSGLSPTAWQDELLKAAKAAGKHLKGNRSHSILSVHVHKWYAETVTCPGAGANKLPLLTSQHMTCKCTRFQGLLRWLEALADGRQKRTTGAMHVALHPIASIMSLCHAYCVL